MKHAYVQGIGVAAPGLADWASAQPVLRGEALHQHEPLAAFRTTLLARNEARRTGAGVGLAFRVAEQACGGQETAEMTAVFASASADIKIADRLCTAVNTPARAVSPTQFHNSVHNAAAGYWSIATGSRAPATSLSGGLDSFSVALREAWAMLALESDPVLLVCFDPQGSGMLCDARRDIHDSFALALLLSRQARGALARLSRPEQTRQTASVMADPGLEPFRQHNPAGHGLPLLAALARPGTHAVVLESAQGNLAVEVASA